MPGLGGQENQHRGQSGTYTSSNERMYYELEQQADTRLMLHPDTLMPIMRPSAGIDREASTLRDTVDGGWAVGFVVADGGVIRKIVPQAPAHHAELVEASAAELVCVRLAGQVLHWQSRSYSIHEPLLAPAPSASSIHPSALCRIQVCALLCDC